MRATTKSTFRSSYLIVLVTDIDGFWMRPLTQHAIAAAVLLYIRTAMKAWSSQIPDDL